MSEEDKWKLETEQRLTRLEEKFNKMESEINTAKNIFKTHEHDERDGRSKVVVDYL